MIKKVKINRSIVVDMSSKAIDQRLRDLSQLFKLGNSIKNARRVGKAKEYT